MPIKRIPPRQLDMGSVQYFEPLAEEPAGNQLRIREGWIKVRNIMIYQPDQFTVAFPVVSNPNNVRWDLVYIDRSGVVQVLQGTEVANTSPQYSGAQNPPPYCLPIAYVFVNEAGSVQIVDDDITDIRPKLNVLEDEQYSNNYVVVDGEYYGTSLGKLDSAVQYADAYSGKPSNANVLPNYSAHGSPQYAVLDNDALTIAGAKLDTEAQRFKTFMGKDNLAQTLPDYSGQTPHRVIAVNDPLRTAIGKIDNKLGIDQFTGPVGYPPTGANPFATVDWVNAVVTAAQLKRSAGYGNYSSFTVNLATGSGSNIGFYNHSANFTIGPGFAACVGSKGLSNGTDTSTGHSYHGYYTYDSTNAWFSYGITSEYQIAAFPGWNWMAVQ